MAAKDEISVKDEIEKILNEELFDNYSLSSIKEGGISGKDKCIERLLELVKRELVITLG